MNNKLYGNLIFELSKEGRRGYSLPKNRFGKICLFISEIEIFLNGKN